MKYFVCATVFISLLLTYTAKAQNNSEYFNSPYLGQALPGDTAELFAPGIISNGLTNRDVAISPDGKSMYFGIHNANFKYSAIIESNWDGSNWTEPELMEFATDPRYVYLEPALSPDGNTLYFLSNMPKGDAQEPSDEDIWAVKKENGTWGKPYNIGFPINTDGNEFFPSFTQDGTMYFTRRAKGEQVSYIYRSRWENGAFTTPQRLPKQVNCGTNRFNAFVAPDESFVVIPAMGMPDAIGGTDYYIVFRNPDDTWQEPVNMGETFNSATGREWSFYLSPDGQYAFFMSSVSKKFQSEPKKVSYEFYKNLQTSPNNGSADIYWIKASVIEKLKNK